MLQVRAAGEILDIMPQQEVSLAFDNPFFESDRIPIALSTPIEFPITPQICRIFQFTPAMLMEPGVKKIPAELLMSGITICAGTLIFDEYSENGLSYTFVGAEFEEVASGKLIDIKFPTYEDTSFSALVNNARNTDFGDFGLPQIMRKDYAATSEYRISTDRYPDCSTVDKYANWLGTNYPFVVPAVRVSLILESIIPNVNISGYELNRLLDKLAILGTYKNKDVHSRFGVVGTAYPNRPTPTDPPRQCTLDLADSMPDMSNADFMSNLLKMTCSTLFCLGRNYYIWANKDILASETHVDWSEKVSDSYSCSSEEGQGYSLSFQSAGDSYKETNPDDPEQIENTMTIPEVYSMMEALGKICSSDQLISVKHVPTGDIISGWRQSAYLYYKMRGGWHSYKTIVPLSDIAYQAGFDQKEIDAGPETQKYDCSIAFQVPRCVPTAVYYTSPVLADGGIEQIVGLHSMTPVIDLPGIGGTRPDTVYIGLLLDNNFVDKGIYFTRPTYLIDPGSEMASTLSLAIDGPNGLYETFHKTFAEWLRKPKNPRKVDLNLSPGDIANLKLWRKYLMYNRTWFIKSLEITLNTSTDPITSTAEIVPT